MIDVTFGSSGFMAVPRDYVSMSLKTVIFGLVFIPKSDYQIQIMMYNIIAINSIILE